jgi:hypothetical protein
MCMIVDKELGKTVVRWRSFKLIWVLAGYHGPRTVYRNRMVLVPIVSRVWFAAKEFIRPKHAGRRSKRFSLTGDMRASDYAS